VTLFRVIKTVLSTSIILFSLAGISVSFAILDRQQALQKIVRYNTVWPVSQASAAFYRFEERVAAFGIPGSGIDQDDVRLDFDILYNRLDIFRGGDVKEFAEAIPTEPQTVEAFGRLLTELDPLVPTLDRPGTVPRILKLAQPLEAKLARLAASANEYGGDLTTVSQQRLLQLHWIFSAIAVALVVCGLAFIILLFFQNRLLVKSHESLRALTDDLRTAKNAADAANEAKSRFLATMSHELRTPLNAVIGFSEIISREVFGPVGKPTYRTYAADILHSGQHMLELVDDILLMAKLDAGHYEVDPAPLDLLKTVDRTVDMFCGTKNAEGRSITVASDAAWPWIKADERSVRQMLLNLLSNAAKFSEPQTPIEVRCRTSPDGGVTLTVTDHGIGMTPQEAAQVVRPFYQADSRIGRKYDGTGLGLSIVSGLMGCHGGRLTIDSEPGVGSRMSLVFPAAVVCAKNLAEVA
jgi:signal transduction histidine kinase